MLLPREAEVSEPDRTTRGTQVRHIGAQRIARVLAALAFWPLAETLEPRVERAQQGVKRIRSALQLLQGPSRPGSKRFTPSTSLRSRPEADIDSLRG